MTIQFGGLATGLDTKSIITQLMALEQKPINKLTADKTWLTNRLTAFSQLDTKLKSFADSIKTLDETDTLLKRSITQSSKDYLTATVSSDAQAGVSYQVEVVSLAQVQKSVSETGVASKTSASFGTGTLNLSVDGVSHPVVITAANNSLEGIMAAINDAKLGVSASIVNAKAQGSTTDSFRLILTGEKVGKSFSLSKAAGWISAPGDDNLVITDPPIQSASQAHIVVDSLPIFSDSNTLTDAISGVTLDLLKAETGKTTTLNTSLDKTSIKSTIQAFAKGYNEVVSFIMSQSVVDGKGGGVLGGDSGINSLKRHLQNMLTQPLDNSGKFSALSQLGFETQKDGTITVNDKTLSAAIDSNLDSVVKLLAGEGTVDGLGKQFQNYLKSMTDSSTGMLKGRKDSTNSNIKQIENRITATQARLEQRQKTMESQFSAMEKLVSGLNSQSSYLTQQMNLINNMMTGSKS